MLEDYKAKRNFEATPEPQAATPDQPGNAEPLLFTIQEHHATHLHWDLRLELDGVLKSWAIPKGPSLNPTDKRLAVMVEDHPFDYATFEGTIPLGNYGAGSVVLWDKGIYCPDEPVPGVRQPIWDDRQQAEQLLRQGLIDGKLSLTFKGVKMKGSWALVRLKDSKSEWLLLKHRDGFESETHDILTEKGSINRPKPRNAKPAPFPEDLEPMLAEDGEKPFNHDAWTFELKLDGVRAMAFKNGDHVTLRSRGHQDITARFPEIVEEIKAASFNQAVLDGELVQFDEDGRPNFAHMMESYHANHPGPGRPVFILFDILYADGEDVTQSPFQDRRALLESLRPPGPKLKVIDSFPAHGVAVFEGAVKLGLEGVIAKRLAAPYRPGRRSQDWLKFRAEKTEDFTVIGYLEGRGARSSAFRSLVLARKLDEGWHYCGNVGTGFDDATLDAIAAKLRALETPKGVIDSITSEGVVHWVRPELTARVRFHAWTVDGRIRFPVFEQLFDGQTTHARLKEPEPKPPAENPNQATIDALTSAGPELTLTFEGHPLKITNLNKVLLPSEAEGGPGFTKRDLCLYYARVAQALIPHFTRRPIAYVRYPHGLDGEGFFQKHGGDRVPPFVRTIEIWSETNGKAVQYLTVENLPTLLWLTQLGALEIHPWQSRAEESLYETEEARDQSLLTKPDFMVLDLDPYTYSGSETKPDAISGKIEPELNRKGWRQAVEVALKLREVLQAINLTAFLKTSGKTGLHVFVPVETEYSYSQVRAAAKTLGEHLLRLMPGHVTLEYHVKKRPQKVFFDSGQNVMGKTLAGAYSTRPTPGGRVSFPLLWNDLEAAYPSDFTVETAPKLLAENGDVWADIFSARNRLG